MRKELPVALLLLALGAAARGDPPQAPTGAQIRAEPTNTDFQLQVTWTDFTDEDAYQLVVSDLASPGAILTGWLKAIADDEAQPRGTSCCAVISWQRGTATRGELTISQLAARH